MTKGGNDVRYLPQIGADKQDRLVKDPLMGRFKEGEGLLNKEVREALKRALEKRAALGETDEFDFAGETGNVDEICEKCCEAHLQIIFQRQTKVVAKGKNSEEWYATVGTMTVRKLTEEKWTRRNLRPVQEGEEEKLSVPPNAYKPQFSVETLLTSDYVELGGPGSDVSGSMKMIKAATHGLAAWGREPSKKEPKGSRHHTYNHSRKVGERPHRALNIKTNGTQRSENLMGTRSGINIHVSSDWAWSEGCFFPVPTGMIAYDILNAKQIEERNKAAGLPKARHKEGYVVREKKGLPYWNGQATLDLMDELIEIVENFARETNQLDGRGRLPLNTLLKCVEVIIREPKGDYEIKYMNDKKTGSYVEPQSSGG